jgi:hypothetical protein
MHDKRTTLAKDIHDQIRQVFGDRLFQTTITKSIRLGGEPRVQGVDLHLRSAIVAARWSTTHCPRILSRVLGSLRV